MNPEYFKTQLTFQEADDFLYGLNRRYHANWECARWQTTFIAKCAGNKNYTPPEFGWEKAARHHDIITEDDIKAMRQAGEAWAKQLNAKRES